MSKLITALLIVSQMWQTAVPEEGWWFDPRLDVEVSWGEMLNINHKLVGRPLPPVYDWVNVVWVCKKHFECS